jgi:signal transduction histidine kinase
MNILEILANFTEAILETQFFMRYFGSREGQNPKAVFGIMCIVQFIAVEILNRIAYISKLETFVMFFLRFILILCFLQGFVLEKIFITQIDIIILQTISMALTSMFDAFVQYDARGYMEFGFWRIGLLILSKVMFIILTEFILRNKVRDKDYISNKIYFELNVIVLALVLAFNFLISFTYENARDTQVIRDARMLLFFLIIVDVMVYVLFVNLTNNSINLLKERMKVASYEQKVKDMQALMESQRQIQKINHDINRKLSNLRLMLNTGRTDEAEKYLNGLLKENMPVKKVISTDNLLVDAVLNHHLEVCEAKNIHSIVTIQCKIRENIETDVAVMLSNLLDNAVEAAEKTQERIIETRINRKGDYLSVLVCNSYDGTLNIQDERLLTIKENGQKHGYGLSNVKDIVKKYNGMYEYDTEERTFVTRILLVGY